MGISGPSFMSKHDDEVSDIMRLLLDFMKDAQHCVQRATEENDNPESESNRDTNTPEVTMTSDAAQECSGTGVKEGGIGADSLSIPQSTLL